MGKRAIGAILLVTGFVAGLARVGEAQEPAAPTGPVSYWAFEEPSGTTSNNSVIGAPAGTFQGGVTISNVVPPVTYQDLHSLSFNGSSGVLNIPNFGTFTNMSLSVWIYRNGSNGGRQSIVSYKETGGGFVLCLNETGPANTPASG